MEANAKFAYEANINTEFNYAVSTLTQPYTTQT